MRMNWEQLLNTSLLGDPDRVEDKNRPHYAQDYDRIIFSHPFRRLANKTQVHPLYAKDHLHHRLIHSAETSSVGRSLGIEVGQWLEDENLIAPGQKHVVSGVVQSAAAAHDIGNPPFGHSGEAAIGGWFAKQFRNAQGLFADIRAEDRIEFEKFEGNAQGFRLLTRLEMYRHDGGMRLSKATLGAFTKYPALARTSEAGKAQGKPYKGLAKFGVFQSEYPLFQTLAADLGLIPDTSHGDTCWKRHPLAFLVEAADDICYNIMDIEDAVEAGDIPAAQALALLIPVFGGTNRDFDSATVMEQIGYYRARAIGAAISACVAAFQKHYDAIMSGTFSASLISQSTVASAFAEIKSVAHQQIFTAPRKTMLEVTGRNIVHDVLSGLLPVYQELQEVAWDAGKLGDYHRQLVSATQLDLREVNDAYSALHSLSDFVSGMTDRYAASVQDMIRGRLT
ncbi:dGTP triphosphohydrolase [Loktanella sp. S4079]|uniref:dGTP triphosphohydrolase n=1 Tax=Loktanella sp. S4079 TaxID=579483 RepID=UPI000A8F1BAB|nr:dNTP triphosphohydrolase [Loktanella sp. S4079]